MIALNAAVLAGKHRYIPLANEAGTLNPLKLDTTPAAASKAVAQHQCQPGIFDFWRIFRKRQGRVCKTGRREPPSDSTLRNSRRDSVELHVYLHRTAMKAPSGVSQEAHRPDPRSRDEFYGGFGLADLVPSWVHGTTVGYVTGGPYGKAMVKTGRCNATHTVHYRLAGTGGDENMQTALHVWQALQQTLNTLPLGVVAEVLLTW
jgi:hypothetical protein